MPGEVLLAFLRLGLTSFGGPVAHLGYFRAEFVERRRWLDERAYADLVGLCQFLPGPASSQTGFALGLLRGGALGGIAAWTGFTLPSAGLLVLFASGAGQLGATPAGAGLLHGLQLVAVAIVAQAVWGMARTLCPDRERASVATLAAVLALLEHSAAGQIGAIALGGLAGLGLHRIAQPGAAASMVPEPLDVPLSRKAGVACLVLFAALLLGLPMLRGLGAGIAVFAAFYRSGALVFGGGHVVLPLLHDAVTAPGWVSDGEFLAGYGAAQAVPGPLFTFAAYLGAVLHGTPHGVVGAAVALTAIFLPGILLLAGILPFWDALRGQPRAQAVLRGVNGLLGAALYDPVWNAAVHKPADVALALLGFVLLAAWRAPPLAVVALGAASGVALNAG
jgi:chromate transporter